MLAVAPNIVHEMMEVSASLSLVDHVPQNGASGSTRAGGDLYDQAYYATQCGPIPYERNSGFLGFFGSVADNLIRAFRPASVFDAGCAHGFLVESLWDRGVRARGVDISEFAIASVRRDMQPYCAVGSLVDPIDGWYDLVCCIEVLEHLDAVDVPIAIANICSVTDRVVFSSTPSDFAEPTHVYVNPPIVWIDHFADAGFAVDLSADATYLTPHALVFVRSKDPQPREVRRLVSALVRERVLAAAQAQSRGADAVSSIAQASERAERAEAALAAAREDAVSAARESARREERIAELVAQTGRLEGEVRELLAVNNALADELRYRREHADGLTAEVVDLRAACGALERTLQAAVIRLEAQVRERREAAHRLDRAVNTVIASPLWQVKKSIRRAVSWRP